MFANRQEAGAKLAQELLEFRGEDLIVVAIPRGGVVVADKVAQELGCPLDLIITRKIGAPGNQELAIGAVAGANKVITNEDMVRSMGVPKDYLVAETAKQMDEVSRRRKMYLGEKPSLNLKNKVVVLIDDGLATGYTAMAAISAIKEEEPSKTILAVPVAPRDTCKRLSGLVDRIVCLSSPEFFYAVGQFYVDFSQTTDSEVIEIMKKYR